MNAQDCSVKSQLGSPARASYIKTPLLLGMIRLCLQPEHIPPSAKQEFSSVAKQCSSGLLPTILLLPHTEGFQGGTKPAAKASLVTLISASGSFYRSSVGAVLLPGLHLACSLSLTAA
jgi:hypothetical protein